MRKQIKFNSIAIQGVVGSNHYKVVADNFSPLPQLKECNSFLEVAKAVFTKEVDFGLMAIENSIAGSILPNYSLIEKFNLQIIQEFYISVTHNLVATKETSLSSLTEVRSHQMALLQCTTFFEQLPHIQLVEDVDTALPAKLIAETQSHHIGALVPQGTAELFDLQVLAENIQDESINETRFVLVGNELIVEDDDNKATIKIKLSHETGSLFEFLKIAKDANINLTKIQSIPIPSSPWTYSFIIDLTFEKRSDFNQFIELATKQTIELGVWGTYKNEKK